MRERSGVTMDCLKQGRLCRPADLMCQRPKARLDAAHALNGPGHVDKRQSHSLMRAVPTKLKHVENVLPRPGQDPATELSVERCPLAELFGQVTPGRTGSCNPENTVQKKAMIRRLPPNRVSNCTNRAFEERTLTVGYQVARQVHLPRRDGLELQIADKQRSFGHHD